jgi:hypothetical protein
MVDIGPVGTATGLYLDHVDPIQSRDSGCRILLGIVLKIAQRIATLRKPAAPDPARRRKRQPSRRIGKFDNDEPSAAMPGKHQAEPSVISWGVIDMRTPTTAARTPGPLTGIFQVLAEPEHWQTLLSSLFDQYRPELHYMRGPGPKWREKHGHACPSLATDDRC